MKRVIKMGQWISAVGRDGLALLVAMALLALFFFLLIDRPAVAQAPRTMAQAAIAVDQTVGATVGICAPNSVIAAEQNTQVRYCVIIRNNGTTTLLTHTLSSSLLGPLPSVAQPIAPGEAISLTTNILNELGASGTLLTQNILANPVGTVITHTVLVTSTNGAETATGQATARVVVGRVGLKVTKTVGLNDSCATAKGIAVAVNTQVKYCITMQNTGSLPLTQHRLIDSLLNVNVPFGLAVPPGATLVITDGALRKYDNTQSLESFVTSNLTNTITFNSSTAENVSVSAQDQAVALIGSARIAVTDTLGIDAAPCGTNSTLAVVSGRTIYHCLRIKNEGTIPLETHEIRSVTAPIISTVVTETVQPGQSLVITNARVAALTQPNVTASTTSNFTITSRNRQGVVASDTATTQITLGTQTLNVTKYATTDPNGCVTTTPLNVVSGQSFYYCIIVTNAGTVPLVRHTFTEGSPVNISGAFTYTLAASQRMTITNQFLVNTLKLPASLGPFTTASSFPGTLTFTSFSDANVPVAVNASFQVNVVAPTPTLPPTVTPFPTFTPTISPTPTWTPIILPTPTATPIALSFPPTPGQPFGVNVVTTPTPSIGAGSAPPVLDAFGQPISPLVPAPVDVQSTVFALTVEAAATQTAWAFMPPPVVDSPLPQPIVAPLIESPLALPVQSPLATPTLISATVTATPLAIILTPLATGEPLDGYVAVIAHALQVSTATLGWLWFVGGSLVFFATAGMFFGLSWLRRNRQLAVYDAQADANVDDDISTPTTNPIPPINPKPLNAEDDWPASLR